MCSSVKFSLSDISMIGSSSGYLAGNVNFVTQVAEKFEHMKNNGSDQGCQTSVNLRTVRKYLTQNDLSVKVCKNIWMSVKNERISTKFMK